MNRFRLFIVALLTVLAIPAIAASTASAEDPVVGNPGAFSAEITDGFLKIGDTIENSLSELPENPAFSGTIDAAGNILVPKDNFEFGTLEMEIDENVDIIGQLKGVIGIEISPAEDVTGTLNPITGEMDLAIRLAIRAYRISGSSFLNVGDKCYIGTPTNPIVLDMSTSTGIDGNATPGTSLGGIPYNTNDSTARIANKTFSAPGHNGCSGLAAGQINSLLGLPSPAGSNSAEFTVAVTPTIIGPIIVEYSATPDEGRVPFPVEFDASASVSNIGAITAYQWDFTGDGNIDQTTTEPTATHTYEEAGVFPTELTLVTDNGQATKAGPVVTAKAVLVTFDEKPPAAGPDRNPHFEFHASEEGATLECRLDVGAQEGTYAACESPLDYSNLADDDYVLYARGVIPGGPGLPTAVPFRIDNVAPVVTVTERPAPFAGLDVTEGTVAFEANEPSNFECRYSPTTSEQNPAPAEFESCESPVDLTWEAVGGTNTFEIRATDLAGNVAPVKTVTWEVDITPPVTTVTKTPPSPTGLIGGVNTEECDGFEIFGFCLGSMVDTSNAGNHPDQSFTFESNEAGSTFECSFNGSDPRPCVSGIQTGLGIQDGQPSGAGERRLGNPVQGVNTFRVWATDVSGNREDPATVATYIYDTVAPQIEALSAPAGFTRNTANTVIYQADETVTSFECRYVDNSGNGTSGFATGNGNATGFVPCDPGQIAQDRGWSTSTGQTEGRKGVQVRATDLVGNRLNSNNDLLNNGGLTQYWTVDNSAPVAEIAAGSRQEGSYTDLTAATINLDAADTPIDFGVAANGVGGQTPSYECSLNNRPFSACETPVKLTNLQARAHNFRVRVKDQAGNTSAIVERNWTVVDQSNASVSITAKPDALSGVRDATFEFTPDATAECRLNPTEQQNGDNSGWLPCASGQGYSALSDGSYVFQVRADGSSVPAAYTWIVDADLPDVTISSQPGILRPDGIRYTGLNQDSAEIVFSSAENPNGATTHQCRYYVDGDTPPAFTDCESPATVEWDENSDGEIRTFEVEPTSAAGNPGPVASASWTIVSTRPDVDLGNGTGTLTACGNGAANGPGPSGCVATNSSTQPGLLSNVTTPRFQAVSSKPVNGAIGYACQLNDNPVQNPCTARTSSFPAGGKPLTVTLGGNRGNNDNLGNGIKTNDENVMKIWAVDNGGNRSSNPAVYEWEHDNQVPTFAITSPTPDRTNSTELVVDIESNEPIRDVDGFKCRLIPGGTASTNATNPSGWDNCTEVIDSRHAKWIGEDLVEGSYALDIRGYDLLNQANTSTNRSNRPSVDDGSTTGRRYLFTIDRTAPETTITSGPAEGSTRGSSAPTFEFQTNESANQIEGYTCRIDPVDPDDLVGGWAACESGEQLDALDDGDHVFQVRALDTAGNQEIQPVTRNWTIDSSMPDLNVTNDLSGSLTQETGVEFTITVDPADSTTQCRLIGPEDPADVPGDGNDPPVLGVEWDEDCDSAVIFEELGDGDYRFEAIATNTLEIQSQVDVTEWTVDTTAPDVTIDEGPSGTTGATGAEFKFSSTSADVARFECQLDQDAPATCESPEEFTSLDDGEHTFLVVAIDGAGNESAPVSRTWTVDTVAPVAEITSGPAASTEATTAKFEFSADKAGSTFECQLDDGSWATCSSPQDYSSVAVGDHTFKVRATDSVGNVGAAVSAAWTVTAPVITECPDGQIGTPPDCVDPPTPGLLSQPVVAGPKQARVGRPLLIRVRTVNVGESTLSHGKVCLRTQKRVVRGPARRCQTITNLEAGAATVARFRIRSRANPRLRNKRLRVRAIVGADGAAPRTKGHVTILR